MQTLSIEKVYQKRNCRANNLFKNRQIYESQDTVLYEFQYQFKAEKELKDLPQCDREDLLSFQKSFLSSYENETPVHKYFSESSMFIIMFREIICLFWWINNNRKSLLKRLVQFKCPPDIMHINRKRGDSEVVQIRLDLKMQQSPILNGNVNSDSTDLDKNSSSSSSFADFNQMLPQTKISTLASKISAYLLYQFPFKNCFVIFGRKPYLVFRQKELGKGSFGSVYFTESIELKKDSERRVNGVNIFEMEIRQWAAKLYNISKQTYEKKGYQIGRERQNIVLKAIQEVSRVRGYDKPGVVHFEEEAEYQNDTCLIFEYAGPYDLRGLIRNHDLQISQKLKFDTIYQIAQTLNFVHFQLFQNPEDFRNMRMEFDLEDMKTIQSLEKLDIEKESRGLIHRDLKPNNVMVKCFEEDFIEVTVIDWAFSKKALNSKEQTGVNCGTAFYQAPEVSEGRPYSTKADIWSLGTMIYEIIARRSLIDRSLNKKQISRKKRELFKVIEKVDLKKRGLSSQEHDFWVEILKGCLAYNPENRLDSHQLVAELEKHPLYQKINRSHHLSLEKIKNLRECLDERIGTYYDTKKISAKTILLRLEQVRKSAVLLQYHLAQFFLRRFLISEMQKKRKIFKRKKHLQSQLSRQAIQQINYSSNLKIMKKSIQKAKPVCFQLHLEAQLLILQRTEAFMDKLPSSLEK